MGGNSEIVGLAPARNWKPLLGALAPDKPLRVVDSLRQWGLEKRLSVNPFSNERIAAPGFLVTTLISGGTV